MILKDSLGNLHIVLVIIYVSFYRQVFCDFGKEFQVTDIDGEPPINVLVSSITKVKTSLICSNGGLTFVGEGEYSYMF